MTEIIAYICMCIAGAGIAYGALEGIFRDIMFELVGIRRRRAIARLMEERKEQR